MMRRTFLAAGFASAVLSAGSPLQAQMVGSDDYTYAAGILVSATDVQTCPYKIVQPVTVAVTEDWSAATRAKVYGKLRTQAQKLGADAVLLVTKGDAHMSAWAWSRREYTGRAVRYIDRNCAPEHP